MGGSSSSMAGGGAPMNDAQMAALAQEAEMDLITDLFNKLLDSCHRKCIATQYHLDEMSKGEAVCVDRCTAKYFDVFDFVQKRMNEQAQNQQQQAGM
eukprot:m.13682 g.13682  ORF g.13682 m.13682 type:complete len:97 (-) comp4629_c0_seq1:51-341(-)